MSGSIWNKKGATLSDKTAQKEFGITEDEIIEGINSETLQYKKNYIHGNPYLRLLRDELEVLISKKFGNDYLKNQKLKNELSKINQEIRSLKKQLKIAEEKRMQLLGKVGK